MSFMTGTQVEELFALQTAVTKNTYTTEAAFSGIAGTTNICSLDAYYFRSNTPTPIGRSLRMEAMGSIGNTAAATFAVNLGFDTTANTKANPIAVMAATAPVASVTAPWTMWAYYTCTAYTGTTMTLQVNGRWQSEAVASGGVASGSGLAVGFRGTISGVDPRVQFYIELFGTWSASSASNTTTLDQMFLFGLD